MSDLRVRAGLVRRRVRAIATKHHSLLTGIACSVHFLASWTLASHFSAWLVPTLLYVSLFLLTIFMVTTQMRLHIRTAFAFEEHRLISKLERDDEIREVLMQCEKSVESLVSPSRSLSREEQEEEFQQVVEGTVEDLKLFLACGRLTSPWAAGLLLYFVLLGFVFASGNFVMEVYSKGEIYVLPLSDASAPVPHSGAFLEKCIHYLALNVDHLMTSGAFQSFSVPWLAECFIVVQVLVSLWILVILIPMLITEAASYRVTVENPKTLESALRKHWTMKYDELSL